MVKVESADEAKNIALDFLAKMGFPAWSNEVQSIKKSGSRWLINIQTIYSGKQFTINLELDEDTGKVISYEKISIEKS